MRASLIKAMVVHSGQPTIGYCNKMIFCYPHNKNHFYYEGHGRVQLDRVLHYDDESDFELFLYYGQINENKESFTLEFTITNISIATQWTFVSFTSPRFNTLQSHHGLHRSPSIRELTECHCEHCWTDCKLCRLEHVFLSKRVYLQREGSRVDWMVLTIITTCK